MGVDVIRRGAAVPPVLLADSPVAVAALAEPVDGEGRRPLALQQPSLSSVMILAL